MFRDLYCFSNGVKMETIDNIIKEENGLTKCGEIFRSKTSGEISYLCWICTSLIDKAVEFDQHIIIHFTATLNTDQQTNNIPSWPPKQPSLKAILKQHVQEKSIKQLQNINDMELCTTKSQCEFCDELFFCVGLRDTHRYVHGVNRKAHVCTACPASFSICEQKKKHLELHTKTSESSCNTVACPHCKQIFPKNELGEHLAYDPTVYHVDTIANSTNTCKLESATIEKKCPETTEINEDKTQQTISNAEIMENQCPSPDNSVHSDISYGNAVDRINRIRNKSSIKHRRSKAVQLVRLRNKIKRSRLEVKKKQRSKREMTRDQPQNPLPIDLKCTKCNKTLISPSRYRIHMKIHDPNVIKLECDICGFTCLDRHKIGVHMRYHSGEKPEECHICGKRFAVLSKAHLRTHTGERPYQCTICGKCFVASGQLTMHTKNMHMERVRPHKCNICTKEFRKKPELLSHLRTHSGERPFGCNLCTQSFTSKKLLRQHLPIHSGVKPHLCKYCGIGFAQPAGRRGHEKRVHENFDR